MKLITDYKNCTGCFACMNICPKDAIEVGCDDLGKTVPIINDKCVDCGMCVKICPENNKLQLNMPLKCYAAKSNDSSDKYCSSGGIATVFSRYIVNNGGYVYGAAFDKENMAAHKCIHNLGGLEELKGSKYVQSYTGYTYRQVKNQLIDNKKVLYIGTPCQIAGLKSFLNREYDNLLTVDLICHGTPPSNYLKEHIDGLSINEYDNVSFRGKYDFKLTVFNDDSIIYQKVNDCDYYFASFFRGLTYRDNCYNCEYAQSNRVSDITVGDFWGLEQGVLKNKFDGKASVVLINTEKGCSFFDIIKEYIIFEQRNIQEAINGNGQLRHTAKKHPKRSKFDKLYRKYGFKKAVKVIKYRVLLSKILCLPGMRRIRVLISIVKGRVIKR